MERQLPPELHEYARRAVRGYSSMTEAIQLAILGAWEGSLCPARCLPSPHKQLPALLNLIRLLLLMPAPRADCPQLPASMPQGLRAGRVGVGYGFAISAAATSPFTVQVAAMSRCVDQADTTLAPRGWLALTGAAGGMRARAAGAVAVWK